MQCIALKRTGGPCSASTVRNPGHVWQVPFCSTHAPTTFARALGLTVERLAYEIGRLLARLAGHGQIVRNAALAILLLVIWVAPIATWNWSWWGGEALELKPWQFVRLLIWPIPLLGILVWRLGWLGRIRVPRPRLPRPSRTTILVILVVLQAVVLGWFAWKLFGEDFTGWYTAHRATILTAIGTSVSAIAIPLALLARSWWRKPATHEDWRRWEEEHEDKLWYKAWRRKRIAFWLVLLATATWYAISHRPWGLIPAVLGVWILGYTWSARKKPFNPEQVHLAMKPHIVGFVGQALEDHPYLASPFLAWLILPLLAVWFHPPARWIYDQIWWWIIGEVTSLFWIWWTGWKWPGCWHIHWRTGFISETVPKMKGVFVEIRTASIEVGKIAGEVSLRNPLGFCRIWDVGFQFPGGESYAGRWVPNRFINEVMAARTRR